MIRKGFTLIEVMVVIGIIGLLAGVVLSAMNGARESAKKKTAMAQLREIRSGINLLEADTGKWPNGCPVSNTSGSAEHQINSANSGLVTAPIISSDPPCGWNAGDIAAWKGPYISATIDPWGNPYRFDPDYHTNGILREDCPFPDSNSGLPNKIVIMSGGKNGASWSVGTYDCDDIVHMLFEGTFLP